MRPNAEILHIHAANRFSTTSHEICKHSCKDRRFVYTLSRSAKHRERMPLRTVFDINAMLSISLGPKSAHNVASVSLNANKVRRREDQSTPKHRHGIGRLDYARNQGNAPSFWPCKVFSAHRNET